MPKLGRSATKLGVRMVKDIIPDQAGLVYRPAFRPGVPNGVSCSPTIADLPLFALPMSWGGLHPTAEVWKIAIADLGTELAAAEDTRPGQPTRHCSIGPSGTMTFAQFEKAIQATQAKWVLLKKVRP